MAAGAERAQLGAYAVPLFRPDLESVAYYEFEIDLQPDATQRVITPQMLARGDFGKGGMEKPDLTAQAARAVGPVKRGFIVVSTGEHDSPIPHWSLDREPINRQLEVAAAEAGAKVARIYKLDALAYVGEDENGNLVARSGQFPSLAEGLPHDLRKYRGQIASAVAKPERDADDSAKEIKHQVTTSAPVRAALEFREPQGWSQYKERYAEVVGPFLDELRRRAARVWESHKLLAEFGEGIIAGESHRVALLYPEATAELSGDGAVLVRLTLVERIGGPPALELHTSSAPLDRETGFELHIRYPGGLEETLRFFVVSRDTPSNVRAPAPGVPPDQGLAR